MKLLVSSPLSKQPPEGWNKCRINQLQDFQNAWFDEIVVDAAIDFESNRIEAMKIIISKMRYGAKLTLQGIDINEMARDIFYGTIDIIKANELMFGGRLSCVNLNTVCGDLENFGLTITSSSIKNNSYIVVATRQHAK